MSSTQTLRFGFPKGHTSFSIYSGSLDLAEYNFAHVVDQNTKAKSLRICIYKGEEEAKANHGEDYRRIYINNKSAVAGQRVFRTIQAPTKKYLHFGRNKMNYFQSKDVPVFMIKQTDTMAIYDLDLSDTVLQQLMKSCKLPKNGIKQIKDKSKAAPAVATTEAPLAKAAPVQEIVVAPKQVKAGSITFAEGTTIADLKRMSFKVVIMDVNDQPFVVETK